ncbi:unnamed protein product [Soboliphyme baturini]|uniref:Protein odr-4 homolog n=1 Tax=Soboliphyme baturini TaxID=241478 RepID=A0A183I947_9BILA|nr:unnamed protein product [Soboliphyme baturini]
MCVHKHNNAARFLRLLSWLFQVEDSNSNEKDEQNSVFDVLRNSAHQIIRMLPGGLDVVGLFTEGTKAQLKDERIPIARVLKYIAKTSLILNNCGRSDSAPPASYPMLFMRLEPYSTKPDIQTFRPLSPSLLPSSVTYTLQKLRWVCCESRLSFDESLIIPQALEDNNFHKQFIGSMRDFYVRLDAAEALIDGRFLEGHEVISIKRKNDPDSDSEMVEKHIFQLLFPEKVISSSKQIEEEAVAGIMSSAATALTALKTDIRRSIYVRSELHYEGMLVMEEETETMTLHQFPRRAFAPLRSGRVPTVCDYLFEGDDGSEIVLAMKDLLSVTVSKEKVESDLETTVARVQSESKQLILPVAYLLCAVIFGMFSLVYYFWLRKH